MGQAKTGQAQLWFDGLSEENQALVKKAPSPKAIARRILKKEKGAQLYMYDWMKVGQGLGDLFDTSEEPIILEQVTPGCGMSLCMAGWAMDSAGIRIDLNTMSFVFPDGQGVGDYESAGAYLLSLDENEVEVFYSDDNAAVHWIKDRWNL